MDNMELPYEVLVYIFKYLTKSDRKAASETCRTWYQVANDHYFLKNKEVVFFKSSLNDENTSPLKIFENSIISYYNYVFNEVEISNKLNFFWDAVGDDMKQLTLINSDICEKVFVYMLLKCGNLESLAIQSCKELFMSGRLLEGKTEGLLTNGLEKLKRLSLSGNVYLSDALFNRFVGAAPTLQELDLSGCSLQFHFGLVRKFYPPDTDVLKNPSESVLTFFFVLEFIRSRATKIKHLQFSNTLIDGNALKHLAEIEDLKLETLKVRSCDQLTNAGFLSLAGHQTYLRELDIGLCTRVTDQTLMYISEHLVSLEYLNIQRCRAVTDLGVIKLRKLIKLKSLNLSECDMITKNGLETGICANINVVIEHLDVHSLNLDQAGVILISEKIPNLRYLDVSYCFNAVTDTTIQTIFKNQLYLHTLKMSHCDKVSDAGLTGMGKVDIDEAKDDGSTVSTYDQVEEPHHRIHLGSRAEEEIVRDARRKRDVMRMCEKVTYDNFTGYSLARIKCLRELDISSCNKITDVSLTYAFNFKELVNLNLSRCQQITQDGIEHLVRNCPSIENINLADCYNLKDEAIQVIVQGLKRLQRLELRGCNQLTDKTLDAVRGHCLKLKFLDVQGCRNMSAELACSIGSLLPTLHTVLMSKPDQGPKCGPKYKTNSLFSFLRLH